MNMDDVQAALWILIQAVQAVWSAGYDLLCGEISRSASFFVVLAVLGEVMICPLIAYFIKANPYLIRCISNWFFLAVFLHWTMFKSSCDEVGKIEVSFPMDEEYYENMQRDTSFTQYCIFPCIILLFVLLPLMIVYRCFIPSGGTREMIRNIITLIPECISAPITSSYNVITRNKTLHKVKMQVQSLWEVVLENICSLISTVLSYSKDGYIMISFYRVLVSLCRVLIVLTDSVDKFTVFGGCFGLLLLMIFWPPNIISAVKMRWNASQGNGTSSKKQSRRCRGRRQRKKTVQSGIESTSCSGSGYTMFCLGSMLWFAFSAIYTVGLTLSGTKELLAFVSSVPLDQYMQNAMRLYNIGVPVLACIAGYKAEKIVQWLWKSTQIGRNHVSSIATGKLGLLLSILLLPIPMSMADDGGVYIDDMNLQEYTLAVSMAVGMGARAVVTLIEKVWKSRESKSNSFFNSEGQKETYPKFTKQRDPSAFPIKDSPLKVHPSIKDIVHKYGKLFVDVLLEHGYVLNPISKVVDRSKFDWAKSITGSKMGMIYALYNIKSGELVKIGMTGNASERLAKYRDGDPDFDKKFIMMRIVSFDSITAEVDKELSKLYKEFLLEVINSSAPQNLKDFYQRILDEWHRGGIKRQHMMQLIETGLQIMYHLPCPSEGFMWDESKYNDHRSVAIETAGEIIGLIAKQGARSSDAFVFAVSSWVTGAKAGVLSSCVTATEYIVGERWRDIIGKPLHPNATTAEEIFDDNFPSSTLDKAHKFFEDLIAGYAQMSNRISHIILDAQHYMYKSLKTPQQILHRHGFRRVHSVLGGEIIVFQKENTFIYLTGHLAIAGDSRDFITTDQSQRRAIVIGVLKQVIRYATCQVNTAETAFDTSAILGSIIMEVSNCGLHGNPLFATAMFRDMITPPTINAIELFGGENDFGLTPNFILYPSSKEARAKRSDGSVITIDEVIRRFSHVTTVSKRPLNKFLKQLKVDIEKSITHSDYSSVKWAEVITQLSLVSLVPNLEDHIRQWAAENDVVIRDIGSYHRGRVLVIPQNRHWNSNTLETAILPQSISDEPFVIGGQTVSGGVITVITSVTDIVFAKNAEKVGVKLQAGFNYRKKDALGKVLSTHYLTLVKVVSIPSGIESSAAKTNKIQSDAAKATQLERRKEKGLDCTAHDWQCKACDTITTSVWKTRLDCSNINCLSREKVCNKLPKAPNTENKNYELVNTSITKKATRTYTVSKDKSSATSTSKSRPSSKRKTSKSVSTCKPVPEKRSSQSTFSQPTRSSKRLESQNTSSLDATEVYSTSASASMSASAGKKRSRGSSTTTTSQPSELPSRSSKRSKISIMSNAANEITCALEQIVSSVYESEREWRKRADSIQVKVKSGLERTQQLCDERREQLREEREYKARIPKHNDNDGLWDDYLVGDKPLSHDMDLEQTKSDKVDYFSSLSVGDGAFIKRNSGSWEYAEFVEKKGNKIFFNVEQKMVLDGSTDTYIGRMLDLSEGTSVDLLCKKV